MTTLAPFSNTNLAYQKTTGKQAGIVFLHGYKSDMQGTKAVAIHDWNTEWGHDYLRFDVRGHGQSVSDKDFNDHLLSDWLDDAIHMFDTHTTGPQILVGSSMGGWLALLLAQKFPDRVKHIIGVAAAPDFTRRLPDHRGVRVQGGIAFGDDGFVSDAFLADGNALCLLHQPLTLLCGVTLLQGKQDDIVPWETAEAIKSVLQPNQCTIHYIEDGDHRLNCEAGLARLKDSIRNMLT